MSLELRAKRVAVFGLGKSGLSAVKLLVREGARVSCFDDRSMETMGDAADTLRKLGVASVEKPTARRLAEHDLLVVSPGVPLARPEVQEARAAGLETFGEVELAYHFLPSSAVKIGVTGTNGKSTTTALCGELFRQGGFAPFVGGNLGLPVCEAVLAEREHPRAYVIELSSFQLEGTRDFKLEGAAILNLTPDHLDRYASAAEYGAAKARIFRGQGPGDVAVVNAEDAQVLALGQASGAPLFGFSRSGRPLPSGKPLAGLATAEGPKEISLGSEAERYRVENRALRGMHNLENAMAAALLARRLGVPPEAVQEGLSRFPGLPHRLESVGTFEGVEWVNDSKATNVESSLVALGAFESGLWLILGGKGKGAPYAPLVEASRGKVKGILTVGQDAPNIAKAFDGVLPLHACGTLDVAVQKARTLAMRGDTVLLSPACASLDQFRNFEERGETFKALVRTLS